MDLFSKNKLLFFSVLILAVLNIILLTVFWTHIYHNPPKPPLRFVGKPDHNDMKDFLRYELGLDDKQNILFDKIMKEHFYKSHKIIDQIFDKRKEIVDEIFSETTDTNRINMLNKELSIIQSSLDRQNNFHFLQLKSVCNSEQLSKLKNIMDETMKMKRPPMDFDIHERRNLPPNDFDKQR